MKMIRKRREIALIFMLSFKLFYPEIILLQKTFEGKMHRFYHKTCVSLKIRHLQIFWYTSDFVSCDVFFRAVIPLLVQKVNTYVCLLYTSPSPRDGLLSR